MIKRWKRKKLQNREICLNVVSSGSFMEMKVFEIRVGKGKRLAVALVLAIIFLLVFGSMVAVSGNNGNGTEITSLPYTITESGKYYLNANLTCFDSSVAGIKIEADNVVIDGRDHKITGTTTPADCVGASDTRPVLASGIYDAGYDYIVIQNLEIEKFGTGVALRGTGGDRLQDIIIQNCSIHDNGFDTQFDGYEMLTYGVHVVYPQEGDNGEPSVIIRQNDIYNTKGTGGGCQAGGSAIYVFGFGSSVKARVVVTHNKLHDNDRTGLWHKHHATHCEISYNEIYRNGGGANITDYRIGGIVLQCYGTIDYVVSHNYIHDNLPSAGYGIFCAGHHNIIESNRIINNGGDEGSGIYFGHAGGGSAHDNELYNNVIRGHTTDVGSYSGTVNNTGYNNTYDTSKNYNDEVWGMKMIEVSPPTGFPSIMLTPLAATLIVFLAVAVVITGYMHNTSSNRLSKSFSILRIRFWKMIKK